MRLSPLLLALGVCTTVSAALRAPWLERAAYSPERRQPTQTHTAPQRRASAGMTEAECIADGGDYILPDYAGVIGSTEKLCSYYEGDDCNSGTKAKPPTDGATTEPVAGDNGTTDPVNKRKRSGRPLSDFMGEILDPRHVVKFLLSDTGTFKHDNGSMYYDPIYNRRRRNGIERNVAKGVISRLAAQSLSAFVKVVTPSYIDRRIVKYLTQKDTLLLFSPLTAGDLDDVPEIVDLLLAEDFTSFTWGSLRIDRDAVEHFRDVLAGRASVDDV